MKRCDNLPHEDDTEKKKRKRSILLPCSTKAKTKEKSICISQLSDFTPRPPWCSIKEKSSVFLCFCMVDKSAEESVIWYRINPSSRSSSSSSNNTITIITATLTPVCRVPSYHVNNGCGAVALGSRIYMLGSGVGGIWNWNGGSSDVFYFDIGGGEGNHPPFVCRKKSSNMLAKRCHPAVVATHGKIYAFGSSTTTPNPWAEVFDPKLNLWSSLPNPCEALKNEVGSTIESAVVANGDKILLCMRKFLFCFNVITNMWTTISPTSLFNRRCWSFQGTTSENGDVLFIFRQGYLLAYDLVAEEYFSVKGFDNITESMNTSPTGQHDEGRVLHLGNKTFCLIWLDYLESQKFLHCVKFRITNVNNIEGENSYCAEVECRSSYRITRGDFLDNCFPL